MLLKRGEWLQDGHQVCHAALSLLSHCWGENRREAGGKHQTWPSCLLVMFPLITFMFYTLAFQDSHRSFLVCLHPSFSYNPLILISFRFNNISRALFSLSRGLSVSISPSLFISSYALSTLIVPPSGLPRGQTLSQIVNLCQQWCLCRKKNRWLREQKDLLYFFVNNISQSYCVISFTCLCAHWCVHGSCLFLYVLVKQTRSEHCHPVQYLCCIIKFAWKETCCVSVQWRSKGA